MQKINEISTYLKTNPNHAITITNRDDGKKVVINFRETEILDQFENYQNFFQNILQSNPRVSVQFRKKNGSTYMAVNKVIEMEALPIKNEPIQTNDFSGSAAPVQSSNGMFGLMGGLNMMDVSYKYQDHQRLSLENEVLKNENKDLKGKVEELKERVMLYDVNKENSSNTKELISSLAPLLAPVLSKIASNATPGLNAPQGTPIQNQAIQTIMQLDDQTIHYWLLIAQNFHNSSFVDQLFELLKKFNLIPKDDNQRSNH